MKRFVSFFFLALLAVTLAACGGQAASSSATTPLDVKNLPPMIDAQTANALRTRSDVLMLDVREKSEYHQGHIPGITLLPMAEVPNRLSEIPRDKTVIVTCHSGNRSSKVVAYLREQGFTNIHDMQGGIIAWQNAGLPVEQ
ncbi:MAG: rhodanese-like domain-containing protein [Caldilineaceae bacterium]